MHLRCFSRLLRLVLGVLTAIVTGNAIASTQSPATLTPVAAVETVRFMVDAATVSPRNPHGAVSISPDGKRWVARLVRGDVARNGVWMEMITGGVASLEDAARPRTIARLFSSGLGAGEGRAGANQDILSDNSLLKWLDARHVAFLWSDAQGQRQVMRVDVQSGKSEVLTQHPTQVLSFDVSASGSIVYSAQAPDVRRDRTKQLREGFVIEPDTDGMSVIEGRINEGQWMDRLWRSQWFSRSSANAPYVHVAVAGREAHPTPYDSVWSSAQSRWALINTTVPVVPLNWDLYEERDMRRLVTNARSAPRSMVGRLLFQTWILDTVNGRSRELWSVPVDYTTARAAWSPRGDAVLLAPTFLPTNDADPRGRNGVAAAVVDRDSGRYEVLPIDLKDQRVASVQWLGEDRVLVEAGPSGVPRRLVFRRTSGQWQQIEETTAVAKGVRLEVRQDLNTPPVLVAVNDSGQSKVIVDPNPGLTGRYTLGRARRIEGDLENGLRWRGVLFYPPAFQQGRRYPLLIQSAYGGRTGDEFSLFGYEYGHGLGPSIVPLYPGRLLSQHDILVLQLDIRGYEFSSPSEGPARALGFRRVAEHLVDAGLVDPARVGLMGFSRNGFYVEYTLTHSKFPYAAAIAADHWQPDYLLQTLLGYNPSSTEVNGGQPFGADLSKWLDSTPGFNAHHVRTPLLQIQISRGALGAALHWELFSRLRYLKKPVEYWVIPNAAFGTHNTQNPEHIVALQTRSIDWFRFWLKGEEDAADPAKRGQYERWRELRQLQNVATEH